MLHLLGWSKPPLHALARAATAPLVHSGLQTPPPPPPAPLHSHVHAPQYEFAGTGTDLPLFDWLNTYTFKTEASFADLAHARSVYSAVVRRLLSLGTTTAAYFSTIHPGGCLLPGGTMPECAPGSRLLRGTLLPPLAWGTGPRVPFGPAVPLFAGRQCCAGWMC